MNIFIKLHDKLLLFKYSFRIYIYRLLGAEISKNVKVYGSFTIIGCYKNLEIGQNSSINQGVLFNCRDKIKIGENCHISPYAQLHTGKLIVDKHKKYHLSEPIVIENNVWIASGAIISAGVRIGENSIVGANSVVLGNVDNDSLYAGNPAKKLKEL